MGVLANTLGVILIVFLLFAFQGIISFIPYLFGLFGKVFFYPIEIIDTIIYPVSPLVFLVYSIFGVITLIMFVFDIYKRLSGSH